MRTLGRSLRIVLLTVVPTVVLLGVAACGGAGDGGMATTTQGSQTTAGPPSPLPQPDVMSIEEALAAGSGIVRVRGALVATYPDAAGSGATDQGEPSVVLASILAESYPPLAAGATLVVEGLDLDELVGLSSTRGEEGMRQVAWSDYWLVLEGTLSDGVLKVSQTPTVIRALTPELRVRFSPASEPLESGETVWWAFDLRNGSDAPLDLTFMSGQRVEVVLSQEGVEKYRWSADKFFTEAIETVTVEPGGLFSHVVNDALGVPAGRYELTAFITATATAADGQEVFLPTLQGTVDVQ